VSEENGVELVLCIVRGADEPRLQKYELERVVRASKKYAAWLKTNPSPLTRAKVDDAEIRLVLDLQVRSGILLQRESFPGGLTGPLYRIICD
jgi:hypothetical protein